MIRVCVAGVTGWTGRAVAVAVEEAEDLELVSGVSRSDPASYSSVAEALDAVEADVLVDYTHASAVKDNVLAALERGVCAVIGSSGLTSADYDEIERSGSGTAGRRDRRRQLLADGGAAAPPGDRGRAPRRRVGGDRLRERGQAGCAERHVARACGEARGSPPAGGRRAARRGPRGYARPAARRSPGHRCTRCVSRASSSRRRSSSPPRASGCRSATTQGRPRRRTSRGRCSRSARCRVVSA